MPPFFRAKRHRVLLCCALLAPAACEKQPPPRTQGMDDAVIRRMVESTAEKNLPTAGIASRQLRVSAGAAKPEAKALELAMLADKLGGTAITSNTPTGEFTVLASLPPGAVEKFCKSVTGRDQPAAAPPATNDKQLVEVIIEK
jgi:hypothetical protein